MSDALSFAEVDGQHVELLPSRTVLSMLGGGLFGDDPATAAGGFGGAGGGVINANVPILSSVNGDLSAGSGGPGGDAVAKGGDDILKLW
jgi:hypothetical protein